MDQAFEPGSRDGATLYGNHLIAQTITAGVNGTLAAVDLYLQRQLGAGPDLNPISLYVLSVQDGLPATSLGATSIAPSAVPLDPGGSVTISLSDFNIPLVSGRQFAIALQTTFGRPDEAGFVWLGAQAGGYERGQMLVRLNGTGEWGHGGYPVGMDLSFHTFAIPEPVPEPTTLLLLGTGLAAVAGVRHWRQRKI